MPIQRRLDAYRASGIIQRIQGFAERQQIPYDEAVRQLHQKELQAQIEAGRRIRREHGMETEEDKQAAAAAGGSDWFAWRRKEAEANEEKRIAAEREQANQSASDTQFETKDAPVRISLLEVKAITSGVASFSGYANTFNRKDQAGDITMPGAFRDTLADAQARGRKMLWPVYYGHDRSRFIGGITAASEDAKGIRVEGLLATDTQDGQEAYNLAKHGLMSSLSIGYNTVRSSYDRDGTRRLRAVKLQEVSLVAQPADLHAGIETLTPGY
jgi:HK97 family phage prohead protease